MKIVDSYCKEDLSGYTDSLLFDSEGIAEVFMADDDGAIRLELVVTGEKKVYLLDKDGYPGEEYYESAADYPDELVYAIENEMSEMPNGYSFSMNNWFELVFTIYDRDGHELFADGEVFESDISKMSSEELIKDISDYGQQVYAEWKEKNPVKKRTGKQK